ncbi:MAG: homoserine O-acetyltransferase [Woeseiaceae bacterium]|nr:homoserine O-acetyltransferase [Woeseiaceae bacterium]
MSGANQVAVTNDDQAPASCLEQVSSETQYLRASDGLRLESGDFLADPVIAYRTWGDIANAGKRAVLICHALTASADADRWWPDMIGPGAVFDPEHDFIICSNILGSCYGTTGPASRRTSAGDRWRAGFPRISVRDMVNLQRLLIDELGIRRLDLVTGPSLGGMQALEWAASYPERVRTIAPIGVGGRHSAWCIAISEAQRAAIYADADWNDGYYTDECPPRRGLAAARMMAVCTYRSWRGFQQRFARDGTDDDAFQMESYLRYQGEKFHQRFDANCYVRLTQAMNDFDIARGRGEYFDILESIGQPALVVSVSSDVLYPPFEQALLAKHLPNSQYRTLQTDDGHDGFLIKTGPLSALLSAFRRTAAIPGQTPARAGEPLTAVAE